MAFVTDVRNDTNSLLNRFANLRDSLQKKAAQFAVYRTTLKELHSLTQRELDDIGIGTGDIKKIAMEAAYG